MPIVVTMTEPIDSKNPVILALDSSGAQLSLALCRGKEILTLRSESARFGQGERLFPILQELMAEGAKHGIGFAHLTAIAVTEGPGSFTGIRTSMAAARGLALALGIPTIGLSSFRAYALTAKPQINAGSEKLLVVIDSRRDALYCQEFRLDQQQWREESEPTLATVTEIKERLEQEPLNWRLTGDVAELVKDWTPLDIARVAVYAAELWQKGEGKTAKPFYLRPPDVSQPKSPARAIQFSS